MQCTKIYRPSNCITFFFSLDYLFGERGWYEYQVQQSNETNDANCKLEVIRSPDNPYMRKQVKLLPFISAAEL